MRAVVVALAGLMASACGAPVEPPDLWVEQVDYALDVHWGEASALPDGQAFVTDLGYEVVVESWTLRTTSVELVPCPDEALIWASLLSLSTPAWAHGVYDHDISVIEGQWVEDLALGQRAQIGATQVPTELYYEAFHAHATAEDGELTSQVTGRFRVPGASQWTAFEASTPYALTGLPDVGTGTWDDSLAPGRASVTVVRHPVHAFDGLQLEAWTPTELGYSLASELVRTSTVTWRMGPDQE